MTDETAYLACRCGQCRITLCDPAMRFRAECLCVDCRQRGLISASRGPGNDLPPAVAAYERFGGDISADKREAIRQRDARPLMMSLEAEINEPHMVELLAAVAAPVPEHFSRDGRTFEALCAAKNNTRIDNAFFEESRAGRPR